MSTSEFINNKANSKKNAFLVLRHTTIFCRKPSCLNHIKKEKSIGISLPGRKRSMKRLNKSARFALYLSNLHSKNNR